MGPQLEDLLYTLLACAGIYLVHVAVSYLFASNWPERAKQLIDWIETAAAVYTLGSYLLTTAFSAGLTRWRKAKREYMERDGAH